MTKMKMLMMTSRKNPKSLLVPRKRAVELLHPLSAARRKSRSRRSPKRSLQLRKLWHPNLRHQTRAALRRPRRKKPPLKMLHRPPVPADLIATARRQLEMLYVDGLVLRCWRACVRQSRCFSAMLLVGVSVWVE